MNPVQAQVLEFHKAGGHLINETPVIPDNRHIDTTRRLRVRLIDEEFQELVIALREENLEAIAKELADLLYVIYGTAISYGIDMEPVSAEVHHSNMTKFSVPGAYVETCDATGKSIKDEGGKTLKPPGYEPPKLREIIEAQQQGRSLTNEPQTLEITAVHLERDANGVMLVNVILPDGRILNAIRDGSDLAAHTAYVNGIDQWFSVPPTNQPCCICGINELSHYR